MLDYAHVIHITHSDHTRLRGGGITRSITVRSLRSGVGVERTFKVNSPRIDKIEVVRHGVRALLEAEPDFCVVGEVGDGLEAVHIVDRLRPDLLIVDLMMPGLNGRRMPLIEPF